jgi:hypothetical protein
MQGNNPFEKQAPLPLIWQDGELPRANARTHEPFA